MNHYDTRSFKQIVALLKQNRNWAKLWFQMMRYSEGNDSKSKADLNCCITSNLDLKCSLLCHWQASLGVCSDRTLKCKHNIIMLHSRFMGTEFIYFKHPRDILSIWPPCVLCWLVEFTIWPPCVLCWPVEFTIWPPCVLCWPVEFTIWPPCVLCWLVEYESDFMFSWL